jgi:hypothetical protein
MTDDTLERLARDAGLVIRTASGHTVFCPDELARFAALVRADALEQAAQECIRVGPQGYPLQKLSEGYAAAIRALKDAP